MKELILLPEDKILTMMPLVTKYVYPAFLTGQGETSYESLISKALVGRVQFWVAMEDDVATGMASTEIMDYEGYRTLHSITTGGDNGFGFEDYHHKLEEFAKHHGCRNVQFWGRKGWTKAVERITGINGEKFKETYRVFSMELQYD